MAFLDRFKKKVDTPQQDSPITESLKHNPSEDLLRSSDTVGDSSPTEKAPFVSPSVNKKVGLETSINQSAFVSNPSQAQNIRWPKIGTRASWLARSSFFFVYADASFLRSRGAENFLSEWVSEKETKNLRRNMFIPQFEIDKLNDEEKNHIERWASAYSIRRLQNNYQDLFASIAQNRWNIVFLTQDDNDASLIRVAAESANVSVQLYKVSDDGSMMPFFIPSKDIRGITIKKNDNAFSLTTQIVQIHTNKNKPARIPITGQYVLDAQNNEYRLMEAVSSNATSITYATNNDKYYVKIYTLEMLSTDLAEQKAALMISRKIVIKGVCWPVSAIFDHNHSFLGILVPRSSGKPLREGLLRESTVREQFNGWNKQDMTELAITILTMLGELHSWNVFFGVLNLATILVKNKNEIFFTDIDEWQIEGYPVLSENKLFAPPEMQNASPSLHFYTLDEINYQIAVMLFMLMMPGRMPYVRQNRGSVSESITEQKFAFGMGREMQSTAQLESSSGFWRFVWDHISYELGRDFYQTFARGGQHSTVGTRIGLEQWKRDMIQYREMLNSPYDPESLKLYPTAFRRAENRTFQRCCFCGKEHPTFYFQRQLRVQVNRQWKNVPLDSIIGTKIICKTCFHESSEDTTPNDTKSYFVCAGCGEKFYYTNAAKYKHMYMESNEGWVPKKWCSNCNELYEERRCVDCGETFKVTVGQYRAYGADRLPRRCHDCQRKKKARY